ncbi:MAG: GH116 family glycosyl hydrolase [Candidatus Berkelbacteria bacterium]|nr:GH116 family glycosyl hydrolase [Candidatus Berkelbacteria bacterium]
MTQIKEAIKIAKADLRSCYTKRGIKTGSRGVYWSWDSFFASFGSLEIDDFEIVKKNLRLYLDYQNKNGNIPKRVANPLYPLRFLKIPISEETSKQKPSYMSPYYTGKSISQCPVFIISFFQYVEKSKDLEFLKVNYSKLTKIINFLSNYTYNSGLLREAIGGGWAESVLKRGAISYTNMCYVKCLDCMSQMALLLHKKDNSDFYKSQYLFVKKSIDLKLWEDVGGGFYSDWFGFNRHHYFNSDGNLLAIWFDIADEGKILKINRQLNKLLNVSNPPLPLTSDRYYFWRIYFTNQLAGIKNYHVGFSWLWLGCLAALVKLKLGEKKKAIQILESISKVIARDKTVHEIYRKNKPIKLLFYKSESPWAWGAGLFIYACSKAGFKVQD